jgi:hypothetical protein
MECPGKQIITIWLKEYMYHTFVGRTSSLLLAVPTSTIMVVNSVPPSKKTTVITLSSIPCQPAEDFSVFNLNDSEIQ